MCISMYRVSIEEKADSGNEYHDPLEVLTVDSLVDLAHANLAVLHITLLVRAVRQVAVTDIPAHVQNPEPDRSCTAGCVTGPWRRFRVRYADESSPL